MISSWKLSCDRVSHTVTLLSMCLASVHCRESLVWFEALGFCYTTDSGPSLELLLVILLLPCVVEILQLWVVQDRPLHLLQQITDGVDIGMGQHCNPGYGPT